MSQVAAASPIPVPAIAIPTIPVREILPWAVFAGVLAMIVLDFVSAEQGAFAVSAGAGNPESVHDGRHLLGFPGR